MAIFVLPVPVENNVGMLSKYKEPLLENTTFSYIEAVRIILLKLQDIKHELKSTMSERVKCS
jgi:hypothetical protein